MKIINAISIALAISFCLSNQPGIAREKQARKADAHVEAAGSIKISSLLDADSTVSNESRVASPDSSAPALTRVFVNNVCTDVGGNTCETISSGRIATANTYTGSNVYAFIWEIGYGNGEIATQGGTMITNAYLVGKVGVCTSGGYYTTSCPAGSVYTGWRYEWNVGHYLSMNYAKNFNAQDTFNPYPYNTYSAALRIY